MRNGIIVEICAGDIDDVKVAERFPSVDRIELNSHLEADGLTPDHDTYHEVKKISTKKIFSMVRFDHPDFIDTEEEKKIQLEEAEYFLKNDADGIVFGSLLDDGTIDLPFTEKMINLIHSYGKQAVFHKAFDLSEDPYSSIESLIDLRCDRILTSGRMPSTADGIDLIKELNEKYGHLIELQPCGGVNAGNIKNILQNTGCKMFHISLRSASETKTDKLNNVLTALKKEKTGKHLSGEDLSMLKNDHYEETILDYPDENEHDH